jgi:hypothetical protein
MLTESRIWATVSRRNGDAGVHEFHNVVFILFIEYRA